MAVEQPKQARPVRQPGKQGTIVPFQPPIKGAVANPFEGKEQGQRDYLAGKQRRLGVLRHVKHLVVHTAEQIYDKISVFIGFSYSHVAKHQL
jgi:hypothetical protein